MIDKESICPNFIYNRNDLWRQDTVFYQYAEGKYLAGYSEGDTMFLGIWLMQISKEELDNLAREIFSKNKGIKKIEYENSFLAIGRYNKKNHFRIDLPQTVDELNARLSSKGRYNIKRQRRLIEEAYGSMRIIDYPANQCPDNVIHTYFAYKYFSHHVDFKMTKEEYFARYHVSNVYVMYAGNRIISIVLSCEQCPVVYIENITYDPSAARFSPGQVIYDEYLKRLIEKGKPEIFLLGGNLDYKRRYGSVEETVYDGVIYRYKTNEILDTMIDKVKKPIKRLLGRP